MSRTNNPFACLAASSNETDPSTLARQQQKSNKQQSPKNSMTYGSSKTASSTSHGLRLTTQHQEPVTSHTGDNSESPMDPELLAALEASLLTASPDMDSYLKASIGGDNTDTRQGSWAAASASQAQAAAAPHRQQHRPPDIQSSDHRNQFPPLVSSSCSQLQGSLSSQPSLSSSASGSLWESFTAVFCSGVPDNMATTDDQVPWTLVGSPRTVAELATATGMSPHEVLMAQQTALLHEASKTPGKQHNRAKSASRPWPAAAAAAATAGLEEDFPALVSPGSCGGLGPLCAGRSPHAVPAGWRGGRSRPRVQGVKVINRGGGGDEASPIRPGRLDLHWDLRLDGLKLKEEDADWELAQYDSVGGSYICGDEAAAAATRELLDQQQAAEAAAAEKGHSSSSGRNRYSKEAVWLHYAKMPNRPGAAGSPASCVAAAADALLAPDDEQQRTERGARNFVGSYDWRPLLDAAKDHGWCPVDKRDGGGGTHVKLRRVVDLPTGTTYVQTMMLASTPGDSQRAIRNAASQFARLEDQKEQLLAACSRGS